MREPNIEKYFSSTLLKERFIDKIIDSDTDMKFSAHRKERREMRKIESAMKKTTAKHCQN
jgi:hypothetical protein